MVLDRHGRPYNQPTESDSGRIILVQSRLSESTIEAIERNRGWEFPNNHRRVYVPGFAVSVPLDRDLEPHTGLPMYLHSGGSELGHFKNDFEDRFFIRRMQQYVGGFVVTKWRQQLQGNHPDAAQAVLRDIIAELD